MVPNELLRPIAIVGMSLEPAEPGKSGCGHASDGESRYGDHDVRQVRARNCERKPSVHVDGTRDLVATKRVPWPSTSQTIQILCRPLAKQVRTTSLGSDRRPRPSRSGRRAMRPRLRSRKRGQIVPVRRQDRVQAGPAPWFGYGSGMAIAPYGSWKSPITLDALVEQTVDFGFPLATSRFTYWSERRPAEDGRVVDRCGSPTTEATPPRVSSEASSTPGPSSTSTAGSPTRCTPTTPFTSRTSPISVSTGCVRTRRARAGHG